VTSSPRDTSDDDVGLTEDEAVEVAEQYEEYRTVPTVDDEAPAASYPDWRPEETRVVTYTTAPHKFPKDRRAVTRAQATAECELVFGRVLEATYMPERFFFRVRRQPAVQKVLK
jgi:hypothetical protein